MMNTDVICVVVSIDLSADLHIVMVCCELQQLGHVAS